MAHVRDHTGLCCGLILLSFLLRIGGKYNRFLLGVKQLCRDHARNRKRFPLWGHVSLIHM